MLYALFEYLQESADFPGAGLFQYLSFRAGLSIIVSLLISMWLGKRIIRWLQLKQVGEICLLYTSPSPRDGLLSRMPSSA